MEMWMLECRI